MITTVVRSKRVAENVRAFIRSNGGHSPDDDYHVDTKYDPPHLDTYYIGDEANGVMVHCEPVLNSQRVCVVGYCRYEPPGILEEGVFVQ